MPRRLLILSCSNRKRQDLALLPAMERYDGGAYRTIRKLLRESTWPDDVDLLILSAKFGLLKAIDAIPYYDFRMTEALAAEMNSGVLGKLENEISDCPPSEVYMDLGALYLPAVHGLDCLLSSRFIPLRRASGRIGERLRRLKEWIVSGGLA